MPKLTLEILKREAQDFSQAESRHKEKSLFGVTDGKAVGTYLEHKFKERLRNKYTFEEGSSASGIDFPGLNVDMKVTSISQPQSPYPFTSARQMVYGFENSLLLFVYEKCDDRKTKTSNLYITHALFLNPDRTGDFNATGGIIDILNNEGNKDDVMAFIFDSRILIDEIEAGQLATEIIFAPPKLGFMLTSNDLRRRMKYFGMLDRMGQDHVDIQIYRAA